MSKDIEIAICMNCGADCSSVQKTDGTIWFCPRCGSPYGGAVQNSNAGNQVK